MASASAAAATTATAPATISYVESWIGRVGPMFNDDFVGQRLLNGLELTRTAVGEAKRLAQARKEVVAAAFNGFYEDDGDWLRLNASAVQLEYLYKAGDCKKVLLRQQSEGLLTAYDMTALASSDPATAQYVAAYNSKLADLKGRYEAMMTAARDLCDAQTNGQRNAIGLRLKSRHDDFIDLASGWRGLEAFVRTLAGPPTARVPAPATALAITSSSAASASTQAVPVPDGSSSAVAVPVMSDEDDDEADYRVAVRPYFNEASYNEILDQAYPAIGGRGYSGHLQAGVITAVTEYRRTVTTVSRAVAVQFDGGRHIVFEESTTQVAEVLGTAQLRLLKSPWQQHFGHIVAQYAGQPLGQRGFTGYGVDGPECIVLHVARLRPEVSADHVRFMLNFLGYPRLAWVKRGYANRSGPRHDFAWVKFASLADAVDAKYRWDDVWHFGVTAWSGSAPKRLHFSFSTHPAYRHMKQ